MRLHRLELAAFGPFRERQSIDLDSLSQAGLFLLHGSTGSGWMRALATGIPVVVGVTAMDAVVVARSRFESSFRYRSAVVRGRPRRLDGPAKEAALDALVERIVPGRSAETRDSDARELAATMVLAIPLDDWVLKVSDGWPEDTEEDLAGDAWAGVVPVVTSYGEPMPAPIEVPAASIEIPLPDGILDSLPVLGQQPATAGCCGTSGK